MFYQSVLYIVVEALLLFFLFLTFCFLKNVSLIPYSQYIYIVVDIVLYSYTLPIDLFSTLTQVFA